jgi:uncharacterized membrane protein YfcA
MGIGELVAIAMAGLAAGAINTVVGSGTLITFPVLLAFGYAPVTANVSNTVGLVPGSLSGSVGYRRELAGQRAHAVWLGTAAVLGGITGAILLLVLPASAFEAIVPVFIALALTMVVLQPRLNRMLAKRGTGSGRRDRVITLLALYATGIYGGYFGAAQGILLLGILGLALAQDLHRTNALKNVLSSLINGVAGVLFIAFAHIEWGPAAIIAVSSILGGQIGARYGRRLPAGVLRGLIVAIGIVAIVRLLVG